MVIAIETAAIFCAVHPIVRSLPLTSAPQPATRPDHVMPPLRYVQDAPAPGETAEVAPGILWVRLPLPFALDHVNLWLMEDDGGWTLIDTGIADERSRGIWSGLFENVLGGRPIHRIIGTHFHPDHVGLLGWLVERTGATAWMTRTEWLTARMLALDTSEGFVEAGVRHDRRAGLAPELVDMRRQRGNAYRRGVSLPPPSYRQVRAGETLTIGGDRWRVMIGEGHAPEQITLVCPDRRILIAADHILPRISPIIGVWPMSPDADPLGDFYRSLEPFRALPEESLVLPSHDRPFEGLHARIDDLVAHHERRLEETIEACRTPATAAEVMPQLFPRRLDAHQLGFALAETLAHINRLLVRGALEYEDGADGQRLYRRIQRS